MNRSRSRHKGFGDRIAINAGLGTDGAVEIIVFHLGARAEEIRRRRARRARCLDFLLAIRHAGLEGLGHIRRKHLLDQRPARDDTDLLKAGT